MKTNKAILLLSIFFSIFLHGYILFFINFIPEGPDLNHKMDNPIMLVDINVENPVSENHPDTKKIEKKIIEKQDNKDIENKTVARKSIEDKKIEIDKTSVELELYR